MDFQINNINDTCQTITKSFSNENLNKFISQLDEIPKIFANSSTSKTDKMNLIQNSQIFNAINGIFQQSIDKTVQLKILKFWDFMIQTCGTDEELDMMFADNLTNNMIMYAYDLSSIEVLQSYLTVLKGISLKANQIKPERLFTKDNSECPIYSHVIPFIISKDSIVVSAARLIFLNLCLLKFPLMQDFLSSDISHYPFLFLIDNIDADALAFIVDFFNVAPLDLKEFVLQALKQKFSKCDISLLCKAATFLTNTYAHSMMMEVISSRIGTFPMEQPLTLGLLLFSFEKKLILYDTAITLGLISPPKKVINFSSFINESDDAESDDNKINRNMIQEINEILINTNDIQTLSASIHCLEMLFPPGSSDSNIPESILSGNSKMLQNISDYQPNEVIMNILEHPEARQKCDIEFLIDSSQNNNDHSKKMSKELHSLLLLAELQYSICKYREKRFLWFTLNDLSGEDTRDFTTIDGKVVHVSKSFIKVQPSTTSPQSTHSPSNPQLGLLNGISISSLYLVKKSKKYSYDIVYSQFDKNAKSIMTLKNKKFEVYPLEFPNPNIANSFESIITEIQSEMITNLVNSLEH